MKNSLNIIFSTIFFISFVHFSNAQVRVQTNGWTKVGDTNTSADAQLHVANATNPEIKLQDTRDLSGYTSITDINGGRLSITKWAKPASHASIDFNPQPASSIYSAGVRMFRYSNSNNASVVICNGDGSSGINSLFNGSGNSYTNSNSGNFGIGLPNPHPSFKLHVNGTAFKSDGNAMWSIASDERLKTNIKKYDKGMDLLEKINPIEYDYNGKGGTKNGIHRIGVSAQELMKVAPHMVNETVHQNVEVDEFGVVKIISEEKIHTINTSSLQWIMINALKEQQNKLDKKEDRIADLEKSILQLQKQINELAK